MTKLWRVISSSSLLGQHYQNVWHFTSEDSSVDELTVKNEATPGMITRLRNHQNVNLVYETMSVQQLLPTLQPAEVFSMAGAHGSLDGLPYHPSICVLFSVRTPLEGAQVTDGGTCRDSTLTTSKMECSGRTFGRCFRVMLHTSQTPTSRAQHFR